LPILTIYYQQKNLNFIQINSLWGIITGAIFLTEIPTGLIADKIGRKFSIIISLSLQLIGEILFLFAQNYLFFIIISIIAGIGFAFQSGCSQALVYDSLKEQKREKEMKKAVGGIGAFFQSGHVLGALASSFIVSQITQTRITLAILLTIVSVGISLLISFLLKEPKEKYKHSEKNPLEIISQSFALIKQSSSLKRIILLGIFTTPFAGYLRNFHPPYFQLAGISPYWLGLTLGMGGIVAALASKYAYKIEEIFGTEKGMFLATSLPGLLYIAMALFIHPIVAVILFISNFGSMSLQDPLFADYYNVHIKSKIRATVLSTINMFSSIYIALMGLAIGWIAGFSALYAFLFMGIIVLLGSTVFRINEQHVRKVDILSN
jgi:MFS family permease